MTGWRVRAGTDAGNEYVGSTIISVSKNTGLCFYLRIGFYIAYCLLWQASPNTDPHARLLVQKNKISVIF
jgi:hypothetical protein